MKSNCFLATSNSSTCNYLTTEAEGEGEIIPKSHLAALKGISDMRLCENLGGGVKGEGPILLGNRQGKLNRSQSSHLQVGARLLPSFQRGSKGPNLPAGPSPAGPSLLLE